MDSKSFCYWLQGYFEILRAGGGAALPISSGQAAVIANHLAMVFKHELDPAVDGGDPVKAAELQATHDGAGPVVGTGPAGPPHSQFGGVGPGGTLYRC